MRELEEQGKHVVATRAICRVEAAHETEDEMTMEQRRRFFAEELEAVCRLRTASLVEAFAAVPREAFLPRGPWTVLAETDYSGGATGGACGKGAARRLTPDDDPARVYHNIAVGIDPARQLFNGQPGTLAVFIDALALAPGARVLHVGCGLGYYTAVMAHCVGPTGRIVAFEVDAALAARGARSPRVAAVGRRAPRQCLGAAAARLSTRSW